MLDCLVRWSSDVVATTTVIVALIVLVILVVIVLLVTTATSVASSWNFLVGEVVVELYKKNVRCQKVYN
jgi:hypothetical protein